MVIFGENKLNTIIINVTVRVTILFFLFGTYGCLKFSPPKGGNDIHFSTPKKQHRVSKKVGAPVSGLYDLRTSKTLSLVGRYSNKKLMNTTLVVRGDEGKILKSGPAAIFKNGGTFHLNYNYKSVSIEESFLGKKIKTKYLNYQKGINYKLKL